MFHAQVRIYQIAAKKLSIIHIFAEFDPLFEPLEASYGLDKDTYLVFAIQLCLQKASVIFSFNLLRIYRITAEKSSIIHIFAQFDPLFEPLEACHGLDKDKYLVFTIQLYLQKASVIFFFNL